MVLKSSRPRAMTSANQTSGVRDDPMSQSRGLAIRLAALGVVLFLALVSVVVDSG